MSNRITDYQRKRRAFQRGAIQATLDPDGPGVARLHLVPPAPSFFNDPPHVLIINGWHIIPIGSSWAWVLRIFMEELPKIAALGRELTDKEITVLQNRIVRKAKVIYPDANPIQIRDDLDLIVQTCITIARGENQDLVGIGSSINIRKYAPSMTAPHRMDLLISSRKNCNENCCKCYEEGQILADAAQELSTSDWKRVIDICRKVGIPQVTFTGGEPTVRPDLVELIEYASWHITRLNTNGVLLTKELVKQLQSASLDAVQVTLYSHDETVHNTQVQRPYGYAKTVAGIMNALEAGLSVSVNTPLLRSNSDYLATLEFLHEMGIVYVSCSGEIPTGGALDPDNNTLSNEELYQTVRAAKMYADSMDMDLSFTSPGSLTPAQLASLNLPNPGCGACLSNMAITPNGTVVRCQSWLNDAGLGNILTTPWRKIWNHPDCVAARKFNGTGCPLSNNRK